MWFLPLLLLHTVVTGAFLLPDTSNAPGIGWQVHSLNDLEEWHSMVLIKQSLYVKVDPFFVPQWVCASQARSVLSPRPRSLQFCLSSVLVGPLRHSVSHSDPRGCFLLTHDYPETHDQYNSTSDVFSFIGKNQQAFLDPAGPNLPRLTISWCFKNVPFDVCASDPSAVCSLALFACQDHTYCSTHVPDTCRLCRML